MAPSRHRPRKGLQRIDAAFDALIPLGFTKEIIRKTIKDLLKVYGGDEGWVFVEEAAYKLVIDTILEKQEEEEAHDEMLQIEGEVVDNPASLEMIEPVVDGGETSLLLEEGMSENLQPGTVSHTSSELPDAIGIEGTCSNGVPIVTEDSLQQPALHLDPPVIASDAGHSDLQQAYEFARPRRPPCYGWISETESSSSEEES